MTLRTLTLLATILVTALTITGCKSSRTDDGLDDGTGDGTQGRVKLSDAEVERRLNNYFLDLDSAANLGELFGLVADGLSVEIVVKSDRITADTPVELKHSSSSLVAQILDYVCAAKRTRYEVKKGQIWILDAR